MVPQAFSGPVANPQDRSNESNKPNPLARPEKPSLPDIPGVDLPNIPTIPEGVLEVLDYIPDPRDIPIIKLLSNDIYRCGWHFYQPPKLAEAIRWGMFYKRVGIFLGFNRYPHEFINKEDFTFPVEGPYYEFPILRIGKVFTGNHPLEDRVIFTEDGDFAGVVTHRGKQGGFKQCKRMRSVAETVLDTVTKPFLGDGEGNEVEEGTQQGEVVEGDGTSVDLYDGADSTVDLDDSGDSGNILDVVPDVGGDVGDE